MVSKNDLIIYDHELAFSFLLPYFGQDAQLKEEQPWIITENDQINWIRNMFLYPMIKNKTFPEGEILISLSKINDAFWDKAFTLIPPEWQTNHLDRIKNRINLVINHKNQFVENIKRAIQ
ncbi:MAG: hypothetical protein ACFFFT_05025 [Candidatus Thorarchaeota archaeon]